MTDEQIETTARACHEANRAWCDAHGDTSQPPWEGAAQWQRASARMGVRHALEAERTPSESHANWLADKKRDGWKFGPVKNAEKKEHPCFMPYEELPSQQRAKDAIFLCIVRVFREAFE